MIHRTERLLASSVLAPALFATNAFAASFSLDPDTLVLGTTQNLSTRAEQNLSAIARDFGLGYNEIVAANPGVKVWLPGENTPLVLPTRFVLPDGPRTGVIVNLAEMRLYYFHDDENGGARVTTYPIGIGREGWDTPLMTTQIAQKKTDPAWVVPESIKLEYRAKGEELPDVVAPGPDNPLGRFALRLGNPSYLIHGTNQPSGIGMRVSHGCIRMYPEHIAELFPKIDVGTAVRIVHQPVKAALSNGRLYLEVHRPNEATPQAAEVFTPRAYETVLSTAFGHSVLVDWEAVDAALQRADGIPARVGRTSRLEPTRSWHLIAGAFDAHQQALDVVGRLGERRLDARIWQVSDRHQVEVGPFADRRQVDYARRVIRAHTGILALRIPPSY